MPTVTNIHIAPGSRLPMKLIESVVAEEGKGLVGDRYHGSKHRHVTIQSLESLAEASEILGVAIEPSGTRRNITISEGVVPSRPGDLITIGSVELEVVRIAAPCRLLDDVIGPGAARALHNRAGSVCRVLVRGTIEVGEDIRFPI